MYSPFGDQQDQAATQDETGRVAREEMCAQRSLGQSGFRALQKIALAVVNRRRPAIRELGWLEQPAVRLVHEFFARDKAMEVVATLCEKATSASSFEALLRTSLENFLLDKHRATDTGAAARRIKTLLRDDERFVEGPTGGDAWALADSAGERWDGDHEKLARAADGCTFTRVEYDSEDQRSPILSNDDLAQMLVVLMTAAQGPVPLGVLVRTVRNRTGLGAMPTFADVSEIGDEAFPTQPETDVKTETAARVEAEVFVERLDPRQRGALVHCDLSVRELAEVLDCSKSTAATVRTDLRALLSPFQMGEADPLVLRHVLEILEKDLDRDG